MSRFLIDAEISIGDGPRFTTTFVVAAPNEDTAFDAAHDYLTEGGWWGEHVVSSPDHVGEVIVHDLAIRQVSAEQLARALTEARVSPRKRGAR
jgi:hypothetical protein